MLDRRNGEMIERYIETDRGMREYKHGSWVCYEDHAAELATIRAENERLREALGKVTTVYLGAKSRTENFGMIYDALNKHAKEALK